jgi:hypothetical protein
MNMNLKIENYAEKKARSLLDSESINKDKNYKLGAWLYSEYRNKKISTHQGHREPNLKVWQSDI